MEKQSSEAPFLQILKGNPSPAEVAALTAIFRSIAERYVEEGQRKAQRNQWGQPGPSFSPVSFHNVAFY